MAIVHQGECSRPKKSRLVTDEFHLPGEIEPLLIARDALKRRYRDSNLNFTLDGNLVGDIGEAIAAELYGVKLTGRCVAGIDGTLPSRSGLTVQVKASGTWLGPAFRSIDERSEHLLFFHLDFDCRIGQVIFNGPEALALEGTPPDWKGQRVIPLGTLRKANEKVAARDRLPRLM